MSEQAGTPQIGQYYLDSGYVYMSRTPTLISTVLGSCVSVCLWDKKREYGGMNHFLYPSAKSPLEATTRFGNVATVVLIRLLIEEGSEKEDIEAQIFGGASEPDSAPELQDVSRKNIDVARNILAKNGIPIVSEDVGGGKGRKLIFNSHSNEVVVIRTEKLRESDWYPYEGRRD